MADQDSDMGDDTAPESIPAKAEPELVDLADSDDSDDESDEEERQASELKAIQDKLTANPFDYQAYLDQIDVLQAMGDLAGLRKGRNAFAQQYPLAPQLWLAWLKDEQKLIATPQERQEVFELFNRAVQDYVSVDLWLEFCQFALGDITSKDGIDRARAIFERALASVGLHMPKGALIWEAYREFEAALLSLADEADRAAQSQKIEVIFKRQLGVPLLDMDATLAEYKAWKDPEPMDPQVQANFDKAKQMLAQRESLETALLRAKEDGYLNIYDKYLPLELKHGSPPRIQCLYERRITDHCLEPRVWSEYLAYLDDQLKIDTISLEVHERSVRNCPWSASLWIAYLRALEKFEKPAGEAVKVFESALGSGVTDITGIWLAFLTCKLRSLRREDESKEKAKELRELFAQALEQVVNVQCDPTCRIARLWAALESDILDAMEEARQIWSNVMLVLGDRAQFWLEFIGMEKTFGDSKHLRKLFPRALDKAQDWPQLIGDAWIQFEMEEGTLEQLETAEKKVGEKLKDAIEVVDLRQSSPKEKRNKRSHKDSNHPGAKKNPVAKKAKMDDSFKKAKMDDDSFKKAKMDDDSFKKAKMDDSFKTPTQPDSSQSAIKPPPGFMEPALKAPPGFKEPAPKPPPGFKEPKPPPGFKADGPTPVDENDPEKKARTVFLSNLDFSLGEDRIREAMDKFGHEVVEVRLVKTFTGKSKGFAYVEYKSLQGAQEALKRDHEPLDGRPLFISEFNSQKSGHQFKYNTGVEQSKLFIKGLAPKVTQDRLQEVFGEFGALKEVRLVTYRNGHSKGIAFVEFQSEAHAQKALVKMDGTELEGKEIAVAISNPPERKSNEPPPPVRSLGGAPRGRGRVQVAFVPRSIQSKPQSEATEGKKSNDYFRDLVSKKK